MIPFNKPYLVGRELEYIKQAVDSGKISGDGQFTKKCQLFLQQRYGFRKALLTSSGTDALEMAAILLNIKPGDEVIMPSYTFVSTANAFVMRGAKIVFADSQQQHPNLDADKVEALITSNTKAIVPVHYAGISCDMSKIMALANKYNLFVVEDAAQAIDSYYTGPDGVKKALGSIGHLAAFSFHETKNIISGEGGLLAINDERFSARAEIIWEKGTNRSAYFRGEVDKYGWVDIGSSFLPSEITAAFLWAQLQELDRIQHRRTEIWNYYFKHLNPVQAKGYFRLPALPAYATNNAQIFYLVCRSQKLRDSLIAALRAQDILAVFHYLPLHRSPFYTPYHDGRALPYADAFAETLLRLPLYYELSPTDQDSIIKAIISAASGVI